MNEVKCVTPETIENITEGLRIGARETKEISQAIKVFLFGDEVTNAGNCVEPQVGGLEGELKDIRSDLFATRDRLLQILNRLKS